MLRFGVALVILGLGSLVLPFLGLQFRPMELLDSFQPFAGIAVAAIGAFLVALSIQRTRGSSTPTN
jgi:hypothetical protein